MIRILTDSSTGFTLEDVKRIGVEMVHMPINFESEEYLDGFNITNEEFYKKLKSSKTLPKTSAINQTQFEEIFLDVKNKGDEMIVLLISEGLSVTNQQAVNAKNEVGYDKIFVIDARQTVSGLIALVMEAVRMRNEKLKAEQIAKELEKLVSKVKLYAYVDTLKYLRAGGRISGVAAALGTVLNVKPIIIINEEGKLTNNHKCIGAKKGQEYIINILKNHNVDYSKPVYFAHSNSKEECENLRAKANDLYNLVDGGIWNISATVGTHTGPGANAIVFFEK